MIKFRVCVMLWICRWVSIISKIKFTN